MTGSIAADDAAKPTFSIVVPTFERPQQLARCVEAVAHLDYSRECFELLVVDDGGRVPLESVIAANKGSVDVRLLRVAHGGPSSARNHGIQAAHHAWIAFTDDDCTPRPSWLAVIATHVARNREAALVGPVVNALTDNPYATASQMIVDHLSQYYNRDPLQARFATTSNLVLPAQGLRALGGFDTTFARPGGEDRDLCDRWLQSGRVLHGAPEAIVDHHHASSLVGYVRQHLNYGSGAYTFHRARSRRMPGGLRVEPLAFYLQLLRRPLLQPADRARLLLLILLSQVANTLGFLGEMVRRGR